MALPVLGVVHVNVNCTDLARSAAWYREEVGLETIGCSSPGPVDGSAFGWEAKASFRAEFLAVPGARDPFVVDLLEWLEPVPMGAPYAAANHLGVGPEVPIDGLWAVFFRDPDGTCLELIQRPEPRAH